MTQEKETTETKEEVKTTRKPATRRTTKVVEKTPEVDATVLAKQIAEEMFAKMKEETDKEIEALKEELKQAKTNQASVNTIDKNQFVPIRSTTHGRLIYKDRQGLPYKWEEFGTIQEMPFGELQYLRGAHKEFLENGLMFIEDKEVAKALRLDELYQEMSGNLDLEKILLDSSLEELDKFLEKAPKNLCNSLGHFALKLINSKELADYNKINLIQNKTGLELKLYLE